MPGLWLATTPDASSSQSGHIQDTPHCVHKERGRATSQKRLILMFGLTVGYREWSKTSGCSLFFQPRRIREFQWSQGDLKKICAQNWLTTNEPVSGQTAQRI